MYPIPCPPWICRELHSLTFHGYKYVTKLQIHVTSARENILAPRESPAMEISWLLLLTDENFIHKNEKRFGRCQILIVILLKIENLFH